MSPRENSLGILDHPVDSADDVDCQQLVDNKGRPYVLGKGFVKTLNTRAIKISRRVATTAKDKKKNEVEKPLAPEIIEVLGGRLPFVKRFAPLVYLYASVSMYWIYRFGFMDSGVTPTLLGLVVMYLVTDLYSGVLHVVLDDEWNMRVPLLSQPCLEFQFHHHIPDDGCARPFVEGLGDLNFIIGIHMSLFYAIYHQGGEKQPLLLAVGGWKMLVAYWGIWNHRQAHQVKSKKPLWVIWMQERGLMLTPAAHKVHHTPPHDQEYCLLGTVASPFVTWAGRLGLGSIMWILIFLVLTAFDVVWSTNAIEWLAGLAAMTTTVT
ncbi:unnamed protein product [Discosporangium mesarthrocarpum]